MFRHPKYYKELRKRAREQTASWYKELRKRNNSDQVISANKLDGDMKVRAPGPGLKQQAASSKHQASSAKLIKQQAASFKPRG
jgi:hypothetical protein